VKISNLNDMTMGWFIGNFSPSVYSNSTFEVGVKRFKKGDTEPSHHQISAIEWTCVISGTVRIGSHIFSENDIVEISPMESADFEALQDSILVVVKSPSIASDKVVD
jgi:hypothetical protein